MVCALLQQAPGSEPQGIDQAELRAVLTSLVRTQSDRGNNVVHTIMNKLLAWLLMLYQ